MKLLERFKAETPILYKRIIAASTAMKAVCITVLGFSLKFTMPTELVSAAGWTLAACVGITIFSGAQVKQPEEQK